MDENNCCNSKGAKYKQAQKRRMIRTNNQPHILHIKE
jgi:hypothetical protein